jgi:hypothetical protein
MDKYSVRRGGVVAAGAGIGAALGNAYAQAKGLPMDGDFWTRSVPDIMTIGAGLGATAAGLGIGKLRQHSALRKEQFRK